MTDFYFNTVPDYIRIDGDTLYTDHRSVIPPSERAVFHGFGAGKTLKHEPGENEWRKFRIDAGRATEELSEALTVDDKVIQRLENGTVAFARVSIDKLYAFYPSEWVDKLTVLKHDNKQ